MKVNWSKTVGPEDATEIGMRLLDTYGLEYTSGWYSISYICNGHMHHRYVVQAQSDDLTMLELGFKNEQTTLGDL